MKVKYIQIDGEAKDMSKVYFDEKRVHVLVETDDIASAAIIFAERYPAYRITKIEEEEFIKDVISL